MSDEMNTNEAVANEAEREAAEAQHNSEVAAETESVNTGVVNVEEKTVIITDEMVKAYAFHSGVEATVENFDGLRGALIDLAEGRGHLTVAVVTGGELHDVVVSHCKNNPAMAKPTTQLVPTEVVA